VSGSECQFGTVTAKNHLATRLVMIAQLELSLTWRSAQPTGYHFVEAAQGIVELEGRRFDLIITDIVMPEMEGMESIIMVKKEFAAVPVIVILGGSRSEKVNYLALARKLGAHAVLQKTL
jgi:CheY-like chemotaxis protein